MAPAPATTEPPANDQAQGGWGTDAAAGGDGGGWGEANATENQGWGGGDGDGWGTTSALDLTSATRRITLQTVK